MLPPPSPYFRPVQTPWKAPPAGVISIDLQSKGGHRWYQTSHAYVYIPTWMYTRACACALHGERCRLTHFIHHLTFRQRYFNPSLHLFRTNISHESKWLRRWIICAARVEFGRKKKKNWKFLWKEVDRFERENVAFVTGVEGSGKMEDRVGGNK